MSYIVKNWSVFLDNGGNNFLPPELSVPRLHGEVYGNPKFKDGRNISTSRINKIVDMGTHKEIHTNNSIYLIYKDDVNIEAEQKYPNYYDRLSLRMED